jgi:molybdopterin synthase catalytic subunit
VSIRIQSEDFDAGAEVRKLTEGRTDVGAIVTFTGVVRGQSGGGQITSMTLEHYPAMTERELAAAEAEARRRWPVSDCLVVHRVGTLAPGENIVLVIATATHRGDAFSAAEFLMDYLKTRAPFWKKEADKEGQGTWVEAQERDEGALERWHTKAEPND